MITSIQQKKTLDHPGQTWAHSPLPIMERLKRRSLSLQARMITFSEWLMLCLSLSPIWHAVYSATKFCFSFYESVLGFFFLWVCSWHLNSYSYTPGEIQKLQ